MDLNTQESRFVHTQAVLFQNLGLDIKSTFLHGGDPAKRVHVLHSGHGDPVLMIHGGNSVAAGWAPLIAQLDGEWDVYAPDRPGCGLTHRQNYRGIKYRDHAIAFIGDVMDGLELQHATLMGNSVGGYWTLAYALAHPDRVDRLILIGEPAGSTRTLDPKVRILGTPIVNRLILSTIGRPHRDPKALRGLMADPAKASGDVIDCFFAAASIPGAQVAWRTMLELITGLRKPNNLTYALIPQLPTLQCPVLIAWGEHDMAPVTAGRELSRHIKKARFELIKDAGLIGWLDQPEAVGRLVRDFMNAN
ncbi:hypothetical protein CVV68_21305 [Arthrobacter livingstonensis]|uniref:AB hydrolase-1 domain-containing protein n=1 Tax=Arthrobacter livingstonensis TaxID=670078 RepID=A0A2V5L0L9_9MICC|nr:alpha/beta hydrolase [Arthrobacter livingstonensis]PYI64679.1 hypothetical protein CVV68_21305 [Arthrobacter livingstonensis]